MAYANAEVPFEKLVEVLAPSRDPSRNPLFQVAFAMRNMALAALALDEIEAGPLHVPIGTAKFDRTVMLREPAASCARAGPHCGDLFEQATVEAMARRFHRLLEGIAVDPEQRISQVDILDVPERARLLAVATGPRHTGHGERRHPLRAANGGHPTPSP